MLKIIPYPNHIEVYEEGKPFLLNDALTISGREDFAINRLSEFLSTVFSLKVNKVPTGGTIDLREVQGMSKEEYELEVHSDDIIIRYSYSAGALYAVETLKQIFLDKSREIPLLNILDKPAMDYRGFMLDSGRYFFPVSDVKKFIDMMTLHKLNVLHWHLTEDQGWRVEIKSFPELTLKGSKRSHTNFGIRPHGGFYTQEQIKEIVAYAHERNIIVIPEFDIPGHTQAAIACYPYLSCFNRTLPVATHWGVKHDILCAGKAETYSFVYKVIDELIALFPDGYLHIGGDEAVKTRWKLCPDCQAAIIDNGLRDETQLQSFFINKVAEFIKSKGYVPIIWNEYDFSDICDIDIVWQIFNPDQFILDRCVQESKNGRKFINGISKPYYLDLTYHENPLEKVYNYNPYIQGMQDNAILGIEGSLWSEFVPNYKKGIKMALPRLCAIAESAWTKPESKDYDAFLLRLNGFYKYLILNNIRPIRSIKSANPSKIRGFAEKVWFGRRIFYWAGLHNEIDNMKVRRLAERQKKER